MKKAIIVVLVAAALAAMGCSTTPGSPAVAKRAILVIPATEVQDAELGETRAALVKAGVKVTVAAPTLATVKGMLGGSFVPDITIADIDVKQADLIAVIGGNGSFALWEDKTLIAKTQAFASGGKYVAAICAASGVLANAGLLKGIAATCYPYEPIIKLLKDKGAQYIDQPVVVSGRIVTGNGPDAAIPFGKELAGLLD